MKKAAMIGLCLLMALTFGACAGKDTQIERSISELRLNLYEGRGDMFEVNVTIGKRENPFSVDGVSEKLVDYCLISVVPAEQMEDNAQINFTVTGGKLNQSGVLTEDPVSGKFYYDLGKYNLDASELNVTLSCGELTESVIVTARYHKDMLSWNDALKVARDNLSKSFENAFVDDEFFGEIYIRFINSPIMEEDRYFWFVMLKDRNGTVSSVLINSSNGEVIAKHIM